MPPILSQFWEYAFLGRALVAGLLMSAVCGLLSPFVVLRGLSFSADGLAHASLGGLAVGLFVLGVGPSPTFGAYAIAFGFTCLVAVAIAWFSGRRRVQSDTAVGACYVAAFALGVLLLSMRQRYTGHLEHFFFGSILAVYPLECWLLGGLLLTAALGVLSTWRWLGQWTFDEELARASGVRTFWLRYGLILLIAATVVLSAKVVGILLVTAMLILPGAVGILLAGRLVAIAVISILAAMASVSGGMLISSGLDAPPGPAAVLLVFTCFVSAFLWRIARDRRRRHPVIRDRAEAAAVSPGEPSPG